MRVISLQSGSNGNCIYVEAGGVKLLFDAGISGSLVEERLALHGRDASAVDAVLISHDHIDHSRSMGILNRMFGLPIYATAKTHRAAKRWALGQISDLRHFAAGEAMRFGKVTVETIPTPHDAEDGVVLVVDDAQHRLGILTDLGHVFNGLDDVIASLDAVLLESNYDPDMLVVRPYSIHFHLPTPFVLVDGRIPIDNSALMFDGAHAGGPSFLLSYSAIWLSSQPASVNSLYCLHHWHTAKL
jgi:phosphoribosyl 1,2-cyclic phosphodiesterase